MKPKGGRGSGEAKFLPTLSTTAKTVTVYLQVLCVVEGLTLLEPQSRSGDKPVNFQVVLSPNRTAVLKGLSGRGGVHH